MCGGGVIWTPSSATSCAPTPRELGSCGVTPNVEHRIRRWGRDIPFPRRRTAPKTEVLGTIMIWPTKAKVLHSHLLLGWKVRLQNFSRGVTYSYTRFPRSPCTHLRTRSPRTRPRFLAPPSAMSSYGGDGGYRPAVGDRPGGWYVRLRTSTHMFMHTNECGSPHSRLPVCSRGSHAAVGARYAVNGACGCVNCVAQHTLGHLKPS